MSMTKSQKNAATVAQLGSSLAVRIPRQMAKSTGLHKGDQVFLKVTAKNEIVIERREKPETLDALCARITSENRHEEVDWGTSAGREEW
jgi:antitoxin MazE